MRLYRPTVLTYSTLTRSAFLGLFGAIVARMAQHLKVSYLQCQLRVSSPGLHVVDVDSAGCYPVQREPTHGAAKTQTLPPRLDLSAYLLPLLTRVKRMWHRGMS